MDIASSGISMSDMERLNDDDGDSGSSKDDFDSVGANIWERNWYCSAEGRNIEMRASVVKKRKVEVEVIIKELSKKQITTWSSINYSRVLDLLRPSNNRKYFAFLCFFLFSIVFSRKKITL